MNDKIKRSRLSAMNYYYRNYSFNYFLDSVCENEFSNIELWTSPQHFWIENIGHQKVTSINKLLRDHHLKVICLTPQQSNPNPYNLAAKGTSLREKSLNYFKNLIDASSELGVHMVALNSGWDYYDEDPKEAWERSVEMMRVVAEYAASNQIKIAVEALQPEESHLVNSIVDLKLYLECVNESNVGVNIDLGAMARNKETISQYFEAFGSKVIHCHFVDGNPVGHKCWGEGTRNPIDDIRIFNKFHYLGNFTFEFGQPQYFLNPAETEQKALNFLKPCLE